MSENIVEIEVSSACRVCLQHPKEFIDLNTVYDIENQLSYSDCFLKCTNIDLLENDDLPTNLCTSCGLELTITYDFLNKVKDSNNYLLNNQDAVQFQKEMEALSEEEHMEEEYLVDKLSTNTDETESGIISISYDDEDDPKYEEEVEYDEFVVDNCIEEEVQSKDGEIIRIKCEGVLDRDCSTDPLLEMESEDDFITSVVTKQLVKNDLEDNVNNFVVGDTNTSESLSPCSKESVIFEVTEWQPIKNEVSNNKNSTFNDTKSKSHRKRFTGKFSCNYCLKEFPNHSRMALHRRSHEADRPKFPCKHCKKVYATKQAMEVHIRSVHTKSGYACPVCGKIYAIKKGMEVHMRYHTGDFPYVCDECGVKFAQMCHLNTHKKVKHNSARFCCEYPDCGKYFTSSASLRNHEFLHSSMPFECSYCKRGYPSKSKLKVHIRRKHGHELTLDDLERMRKFHVARAKLNLVKITKLQKEGHLEEKIPKAEAEPVIH